MSESPKLGLHLTPEETEETFLQWRTNENGEQESSNMMKIDAAVGALQDRQDEIDSTPFTWGMLKNGLNG